MGAVAVGDIKYVMLMWVLLLCAVGAVAVGDIMYVMLMWVLTTTAVLDVLCVLLL